MIMILIIIIKNKNLYNQLLLMLLVLLLDLLLSLLFNSIDIEQIEPLNQSGCLFEVEAMLILCKVVLQHAGLGNPQNNHQE
jgi:hypothetical protein